VDVAYPRLSDWTCLQWALHSLIVQQTGPFSAWGVAMWLFPNYFGVSPLDEDEVICMFCQCWLKHLWCNKLRDFVWQ